MSPFAAADGDDGGDAQHPRHHRRPYPNLLTDLQSHNDYFDSIVNMIPAKLYISAGASSGGGSSSGSSSDNVKYRKGQHVESKEAKRAKDKAAKYDPKRVETTLQTKKRVRMEEKSDDDVEDDIVMSDDDCDDDDDNDDGSEATEPTGNIGSSKKIIHNNNTNNTVASTETSPVSVKLDEDISSSYPSRIEALRAKLRAKVAALAGSTKNVGAIDGESGGGTVNPALTSKRAARRAEKKRRMEAAKQRAGKTGSSSVVASADGSNNKKRRLDTTTSMGKSSMTSSSSSSSSAITTTTTTVANDLARIDYQSLAGLRPKLEGALDNKSLVGIGGTTIPSSSSSNKGKKKASLEKLLADAERKQARLRELKTSNNEADKEKARSIVWQDTFKVASVGGSGGDSNSIRKMDPAVIKKAIKRKAKKKVASAKAWNSRIEKVHDAVSERQRIRSHNIDQRKLGGATAANLSSKRIVTDKDSTTTEGGGDCGKDAKGEKRRRLGPHSNRAGFEGKKNDFINGKHQGDGGGSTSVAASGGGGGKKGGR